MADWSEDEFMSEWNKKYVSTNLKPGARPYSKELFLTINSDLVASQPELEGFSYAIIAAACCATGRADVVGQFFDHLTAEFNEKESEATFLRLREAITIIFPYLGLPSCMPACYGMIGVVQRKGKQFASVKKLRKDTVDAEDARKGAELRAQIYKGVGNSDIFDLMKIYFSDLYACSTIVTWGYLIAKTNEEVFEPRESHLIVATAITALGATRQTKSHVKASLGIGNSISCIKAVIDAVSKICEWADRPIASFDVDQLSQELRASLKA
ncbi:hypothetical protein T440DRAFT_498203 [Plenodomus tracheiphilus IPT5]|uniref:Carboxymuconolactone decarboxylase-like domain-containing protein n=1 Tax=Plenodomus tracheiphilus IPT5 TaxID=1408161 RepID=A0A6A7BB74_9PLEO|nr:hypothetical protein T440DRAFT_498203 [Plenodomus tracheiphilus IPT5]